MTSDAYKKEDKRCIQFSKKKKSSDVERKRKYHVVPVSRLGDRTVMHFGRFGWFRREFKSSILLEARLG